MVVTAGQAHVCFNYVGGSPLSQCVSQSVCQSAWVATVAVFSTQTVKLSTIPTPHPPLLPS